MAKTSQEDFDFNNFFIALAKREPALRIDNDSIIIHAVKSVKISTETSPVGRTRDFQKDYSDLTDD